MRDLSAERDEDDLACDPIESLLDELAHLAAAEGPAGPFHMALVERMVAALAGLGGIVWGVSAEELPRMLASSQLSTLDLSREAALGEPHQRLIMEVARRREGRTALPKAKSSDPTLGENPTSCLLVLQPVLVRGATVAVLEVFQRPVTDAAAHRGYLRFLAAVATVSSEFFRNERLRVLWEREQWSRRFQGFVERTHRNRRLKEVASVLANEGARVLEVDRLGVALQRGSRYRLASVSAVDSLDRRSAHLQALERLVTAVARGGEPLWSSDAGAQLSPTLERALSEYQESSKVHHVAVIPLYPAPAGGPEPARRPNTTRPRAVLIVESFERSIAGDEERLRVDAVARQAAIAVANAQEFDELPLAGLLRSLGRRAFMRRLRRLPWWILGAGLVAAAVWGLVAVPIPFDLEGRGELWPERRQAVFSPADGVVEEVLVDYDDVVDRERPDGDRVATIRRPELELEIVRITGEIQTAVKRQAAIEATRLSNTGSSQELIEARRKLAADGEANKELLASLRKQLDVLEQQRQDLVVRAPISGRVITWDARRLLAARPIRRGQILLTVADLGGPWEVELWMPDHRSGYLREALAAHSEPLAVSFTLRSDPATVHSGRIEAVASTVETAPDGQNGVRVTVRLDGELPAGARPGAEIVGRAHCGKRSAGFVWFHELYEAARARWMF